MQRRIKLKRQRCVWFKQGFKSNVFVRETDFSSVTKLNDEGKIPSFFLYSERGPA